MIKFTYDLNSESVEKALAAFQASLAENAGALARIADDFREMVAEQFASEGRAGGTPWAELAPSTARRRRPGSTILYSTGALLRSLGELGAADHREELEAQSLVLGSRLPYALYHQTGTGRGFGQSRLSPGAGRGMPMRPLIALTGERVERWVELLRQRLEETALLLGAKELGSQS